MYSGVPIREPMRVNMVSAVSFWSKGFGDTEIDDFGDGAAIKFGDEDVGGLKVAVDDGFLVGVLNAFAHVQEEFESFRDGEAVLVAVDRDGCAGHVLHHEVGRAFGRGAGVEHAGDGGMVHEG